MAAANSGATAHTTTAPLSRDATAASHAVEKRATTTNKAALAAMALTQLRNTEVKPQLSSVSPAARMKTLLAAGNFSNQLVTRQLWAEAKQFIREQIPLALDVVGPNDDRTLKMRWRYALVLQIEEKYTEAVAILEDVARRYRRVFGISHPMTAKSQGVLEGARGRLSYS